MWMTHTVLCNGEVSKARRPSIRKLKVVMLSLLPGVIVKRTWEILQTVKGHTDVRTLMVLLVQLQQGFDLARVTQVVDLLGWNMRMFDFFQRLEALWNKTVYSSITWDFSSWLLLVLSWAITVIRSVCHACAHTPVSDGENLLPWGLPFPRPPPPFFSVSVASLWAAWHLVAGLLYSLVI